MNDTVQMIFGLLGGLALFLFGMNMMSESLQKAAGDRMRSVLAFLTKNPVMGVISGALVTAVLQDRLCQRRADDTAAGHFHYFRCQHRYDHHGADHRL